MMPKASDDAHLLHAVWFVPVVFLIIALLPFPYGFYVFLRIVVCITAAILVYHEQRQRYRISFWVIVFGLMAVLFNPIIPVHLTREIWIPINVASAAVFALHWHQRRPMRHNKL